MIHIKQGRTPLPRPLFNEAFMLHTSTSPQYGIVASLDVAAKMMEGAAGRALVDDAVDEAISFRQEMTDVRQAVVCRWLLVVRRVSAAGAGGMLRGLGEHR